MNHFERRNAYIKCKGISLITEHINILLPAMDRRLDFLLSTVIISEVSGYLGSSPIIRISMEDPVWFRWNHVIIYHYPTVKKWSKALNFIIEKVTITCTPKMLLLGSILSIAPSRLLCSWFLLLSNFYNMAHYTEVITRSSLACCRPIYSSNIPIAQFGVEKNLLEKINLIYILWTVVL